jgi:SAM-dependent methyltransferase
MKPESSSSVLSLAESARRAWGLIRCPVCRSAGELCVSHWRCFGCSRGYQRYSQIVDFRVAPGREDLSFAHLQAARAEKDRISRALELAANVSFADLVDAYFREFPTHPSIERGEKGTLLHAEVIAREVLFQMGQSVPFAHLTSRPGSVALDVGCGAAGLTGILATNFSAVIAMDADLDRMVLAERHCTELGLDNVALICAFGESMPLTSDAFDFISCVEVLEHATSQVQLISELQRILRSGGMLYLTTPNRFSAAREPHVNLWGLGWLPRRLMDPYVRLRLGVPYAGKRNLSYWELRRMMKAYFGPDFEFRRPRRSRYTAQARIANSLLRIPGLTYLVNLVVGGYHVLGCKPSRPGPIVRKIEMNFLK